MKFFEVENDEKSEMYKIRLEDTIQDCIFKDYIQKEENDEEIKKVKNIVLEYQSRQYRSLINKQKDINDFDLFTLSC